jgi:hypothetical protein
MTGYFIALAVATFFTRAGLILGGSRALTLESLAVSLLWAVFGAWGLYVLLGGPK